MMNDFQILFCRNHSSCIIQHSSFVGGGGGIRTYSAVKHQIYSLARLSNSGAPPWVLLSVISYRVVGDSKESETDN